ncbi:tetratricopeptide repeat protein [Azospirillum sp. sgz302134]
MALSLLAAPALAGPEDSRLDPLFRDLLGTSDQVAAEAVEDRIWEIWLDNPRQDVLALMRDGVQKLNDDQYDEALALFDRVVATDPTYVEGWDKRANAEYLLGNYDAAVQDIRRVLALEPRHFAALAGLGLVYLAIDEPEGALRAFNAALAINPHLDGVREQAMKLRHQMAGLAL